jgi:cytochrome oxidase assembly protein ShyY1
VPVTRYRFLLSARWVGAFLLCVVAAVVCCRLALWQQHRLETKQAINASIDNARTADPLPVARALSTTAVPTERHQYIKVSATGRYDVAGQVMVRNQTLHADIGFSVLTPLRTTDGPTLWVVRGWIQAGDGSASQIPKIPDPPSGLVTVVGRVKRPASGATDAITVNGQHLISRITRHQLRGAGAPAYRGYVQMISEQPPATDTTTLTALPAPDDLDEGIHLAYEVQWYLFAVGFVAGFFWYARNYARRDDDPALVPAGGSPAAVKPSKPKRQRYVPPTPVATRNGVPVTMLSQRSADDS